LSILNGRRAAVQSERATRSQAPSSTLKNRLALARPAAASVRGSYPFRESCRARRPRDVRTGLKNIISK
jgi:hypothetical protein